MAISLAKPFSSSLPPLGGELNQFTTERHFFAPDNMAIDLDCAILEQVELIQVVVPQQGLPLDNHRAEAVASLKLKADNLETAAPAKTLR